MLANLQMEADAPDGPCDPVAAARGSFATLAGPDQACRLPDSTGRSSLLT
jgi:hypothetical protein